MLLRMARAILLLLFVTQAVVAAPLFSSDARLIALVPPESQVIAGMRSPTTPGQPDSLLLVTGKNRLDYEDFFAVTGADASRRFREVIFIAAVGAEGWLSEHSLLVSGQFDRDTIFKFANGGKATVESYAGFRVLAVPAFARERGEFEEVRWLAVLNLNVAVFGSISSVKQEIDRYVAKMAPDPALMERLFRLGRADDAWCLLPSPGPGVTIPRVLEKLDPKLGAFVRDSGSMQYGFHFGRQVEITVSVNLVAQENRNMQSDQSSGRSTAASYLVSRFSNPDDAGRDSIVVKIPRRRYAAWLTEYARGSGPSAWHPQR